ncbi:hypothetical protein AVEN_164022-1 [Araneus ventricosus]|uniref:Histone-lysine N-methyltransferase SETMAR n=1 Tax=Araneus ventricosus TaxID=182803 RepID=A0A4Y2UK15_ARAVE|nr:hypothetical protein AVEN_164022-1 [Araneus ventricosus]
MEVKKVQFLFRKQENSTHRQSGIELSRVMQHVAEASKISAKAGSGKPQCLSSIALNLLITFRWEVFKHLPYSPDISPCDSHIFISLKYQRFTSDKKVQDTEGN